MKSRFQRFLVGSLACAVAFTYANLLPVPRMHPVGQQDVIRHLGFPFFFQRWGGVAGIEEFRPTILFIDIALGLIVSLLFGYACSRMSPGRTS